MLGFLIAFWATPNLTLGHLLFATTTTAYILVALVIEERTLVELHGDAYRERERIDYLQDYLRDLWNQSVSFHERGQSVEAAIAGIDLSAHADRFGGSADVNPIAVTRIFELLEGSDD